VTTGGNSGDVVGDVLLAAVEKHFDNVSTAPAEIEWLTFNAGIGLKPLTAPMRSGQVTVGGKFHQNDEA
jgi:putative transposase